MTEITRTVQQLVADIDVDDDGLVRIHVTQPLTPEEARDAAAAMIVAAQTGEAYRVEQSVRDNASAGGAHVEAYCATCAAPAVRDVLSTGGWRHLFPAQGAQRHVAVVEEAGL